VDGQNDEILFDDPQYDVENLLTQFDYGNGIRATYTYDSLDRLSTIDIKDGVTSLLDLDYTYDNNSNITQLVNGWRDTSSSWHSETESYSYDGLDRLTSGSCTSWSHSYSYDKAGNRTGKDSITYTVNSVNEVTDLSDGTSFTYDDNGNRIQKTKGTDTWDYTYDYANRLTEVEENDSTIGEYMYDGDGKRLQKTENSITTTYIYSGINTVYEENSTGFACYIYGPIGLIAKRTTINQESNTYFYHKDHLGSTRSVTDSSKNIIKASTYHPFGETEVEEGSEHYLYNGKQKDSTGLYYYGARYYDPQIGKFITRDLLKGKKNNSQSLNRYIYCFNNPLNYIDSTGLSATSLHTTLPDGTDITINLNYKGEIFISFLCGGVRYTLKISNDYKDWDLYWQGKGGNFLEINLIKDGIISSIEGMAFFLGFCDWGRFKGAKPNDSESIELFIQRLQEEGTILSENDIDRIKLFFELGKRLGQWVAANDNNLYRLYCPAPFNDAAWKQMVNKMAVELIFAYPWNPFPIGSIEYITMEYWILKIKEYLYPD
jgi:RHS repeat-associated protein